MWDRCLIVPVKRHKRAGFASSLAYITFTMWDQGSLTLLVHITIDLNQRRDKRNIQNILLCIRDLTNVAHKINVCTKCEPQILIKAVGRDNYWSKNIFVPKQVQILGILNRLQPKKTKQKKNRSLDTRCRPLRA